jgi:hypothetical protein
MAGYFGYASRATRPTAALQILVLYLRDPNADDPSQFFRTVYSLLEDGHLEQDSPFHDLIFASVEAAETQAGTI